MKRPGWWPWGKVKDPDIVLCVPGSWKHRGDLLERIAGESGGYLFAGLVLMRIDTQEGFGLEVADADPRMARAFAAAGWNRMSPEDLAAIGQHTFVLYLTCPGGSRERAEAAMAAADGLLRAGGLAVKVETAGLAHSRDVWRQLAAETATFSAYRALVAVVTGAAVYSCGMHNLGLRDAVVEAADAEDPAALVSAFNFYQFAEKPTIRSGQTFGVAAGARAYRLSAETCTLYDGDPCFTNPYGMWRLRPVD